MKNKFTFFLILFFFFETVHAKNLLIQAKNITLNKENQLSIFKEDVFVKTDNNHTIRSNFAEYDKKNGIVKFKDNVILKDNKNNIINTNDAEYNENNQIFKTNGFTKY